MDDYTSHAWYVRIRPGIEGERCRAFGDQVRRLRTTQRYSQEALAHLADLDRTYVGGVERGERNIALVNIWRLADALKVEPAAFFEITIESQAR